MNWNYARYGIENVEKFGEYDLLLYEEEGLEQHFSNVQIQTQSNAFANGLSDLGVKEGEVVAVILPNGPCVPIASTAVFKLGAVYLPIVFALTASEIRYILKDSGATTIITDWEIYPKVEEAAKDIKKIRNRIVVTEEGIDSFNILP